jgi:c-di-GMP-binding flagellar brake protein YcgR
MNVYGLQFDAPSEMTLEKIRVFLDQHLKENRRKSFRLERILVVEMHVEGKSSRFGVFTLDLSTSGMRINHEEPLPEGVMLDFRILLEPGQAPVAVKSEVSWQKENAFGHYLIGLRFTDIDPEAEARIESYIHQALARSSHGSSGRGGGIGLSSFLPNA